MRTLLLLLSILLPQVLWGQGSFIEVTPQNAPANRSGVPYLRIFEGTVNLALPFGCSSTFLAHIENPGLFTAVVVQVEQASQLQGGQVLVEGVPYNLQPDAHYRGPNGQVQSVPIHFETPQSTVVVLLKQPTPNVQVLLANGTPPAGIKKRYAPGVTRQNEQCAPPQTVPQSIWRQGLPAPTSGRSFAPTQHLIVHHSAGSNSNTNYTQVVRDIYIFHTQGRGWADVGYNYLIAQNGSIYAGRSPEQGNQDEVIGAHFCGRNTGAMGVCLLGNYNTAAVPPPALQNLEALLAWKAQSSQLNVLASQPHPLNPNLPVLAGHQQGCATECPGTNLFALLPTLRNQVAARVQACQEGPPPAPPVQALAPVLYPNPLTGSKQLFIGYEPLNQLSQISLYKLGGSAKNYRTFAVANPTTATLDLSALAAGIYLVRLQVLGQVHYKRLVVL